MSQRNPSYGQHGQQAQQGSQQGRQGGQQGVDFRRDPNTGRFLDQQESQQLQQYAQQHPQEVQRAYRENEPIPGISYPDNAGQGRSQQSGGQQQYQQQPQQMGQQGGQGFGGRQSPQGGYQQSQQGSLQQQGGYQQGGRSQQPMGQQGGMQPSQQQGYIPAQQEPASNEPGWPGKQGRGADQGAADRRHSPEFRQRMSEVAQHRPRDPQTGQFLPSGQGGQQGRQGGQQSMGQQGGYQQGQGQQQYGRR